jgi:hypothetical protein
MQDFQLLSRGSSLFADSFAYCELRDIGRGLRRSHFAEL